MKFSRNPISGEMESYSDTGVFAGRVFTMADFIGQMRKAEDGGPGSGNWGHRGRPGKVGGSGKGGGTQYRGGRSDIAYVGSRKDWLNGLTGEKQLEAARNIATLKKSLNAKLDAKKKIEALGNSGLLTFQEVEQRLKEGRLDQIHEGMKPEEYAMKAGGAQETHDLLSLAKTARNWEKNKDRLLDDNLSESEKAIYQALSDVGKKTGGYSDVYGSTEAWKGLLTKEQLEAKALGLVDFDVDVPDEVQYRLGVKQRPVPPKPKGPDYSWYEKRPQVYTTMEGYMGSVTDVPSWGKKWENKEDFEKLNKNFLDTVKYGKLSPTKCRYALRSLREMRSMIGMEERDGKYYSQLEMKVTPEMIGRLDDDEKDRLLRLMNRALDDGFNPEDKFKSLEEITDSDYARAENAFSGMELRTNTEQQVVRDYVMLMDKMLTGEVPSDQDTEKAKKEAAKEEAKKKREEWLKKRDEEQKAFVDSGKAEKKKEIVKKVAEINDDDLMKMDNAGIAETVRNSGMFRDGSVFVTSPLIPPKVYAAATLAYKKVIERFPFLAGELGGFGDNYTAALAGCSIEAYSASQTEIVINYNKFSNPEEFYKHRKEYEANNGFVKTDDDLPPGYADVMHELGHALSNWLHRYTYGEFTQNPVRGYDNEVATMLKKNVLKKLGIPATYENIRDEVSKYASASRNSKDARQPRSNTLANEFFAECFAELMCNSHPRRVAVEFGKQLEEFIRKNKITGASSATTPLTMPKRVR